eukprot:123135_1
MAQIQDDSEFEKPKESEAKRESENDKERLYKTGDDLMEDDEIEELNDKFKDKAEFAIEKGKKGIRIKIMGAPSKQTWEEIVNELNKEYDDYTFDYNSSIV